jgi:prevent-host-death family protein
VADDNQPRIPIGEFARNVSRVLKTTQEHPVTLTRNGQPVAVVLDFDTYRKMAETEEAAEDLYWTVVALLQDVKWAMAGRPSVSLDEVEARSHG